MKNVITALYNPELNIKLTKEENIKILIKDIQYQEGIFEIIEKNYNIDYLIISELLPGNYKIEDLIDKIIEKNNLIKIILILEEPKEKFENLLYIKGVYKIYYNNKVEINEIINLINNKNNIINENELLKKELNQIKLILESNNINLKKNKEKRNNKKVKQKKIKKEIQNKQKKLKIKILNINKINNKYNNKKNKEEEKYKKNNNKIIKFNNNKINKIKTFKSAISKIVKLKKNSKNISRDNKVISILGTRRCREEHSFSRLSK